MKTRTPPAERFVRSFEIRGDCWIWIGRKNSDGYGTFFTGDRRAGHNGRRGSPVTVLAHRWAYEHFHGPVPAGLYVLHSCDTPACVNPAHLRPGTQADNVQDCAQRGRRNQSRDRRLTAEQKREIRVRYTGAYGQQTALAREFGVSQTAICAVVGGRARNRSEAA